MKILLSRPVLGVLLSNADVSTSSYSSTDALQTVMNQTVLEKISKHCVQAAQDLTSLVYDSLMSGDVPLPAWWYNVFCKREIPPLPFWTVAEVPPDLYTTATIFVAQRLCPSLIPAGADDQWQQCWDKCLRGLHKYKYQSTMARRCFKVLDLINKQFFRTKDRGKVNITGCSCSDINQYVAQTSSANNLEIPASPPTIRCAEGSSNRLYRRFRAPTRPNLAISWR